MSKPSEKVVLISFNFFFQFSIIYIEYYYYMCLVCRGHQCAVDESDYVVHKQKQI